MNHMKTHRLSVMLLVVIFVLNIVTLTACMPKAPRVYIALGDSVPYGFGIEHESRHPDLFFEMLKSDGLADEYYNLAANGYTTSILLDFLESTEDLEPFTNASVITLNIGGNNVMAPFNEYLPNMDELSEGISELIAFIVDSSGILSEAMELTNEAHELMDEFSVSDIFELITFIQKAAPILEDISGVLREGSELELLKLFPLLLGTFPEELETELQAGVDTFADDFRQIINWLETNAPNAVIIVNTIYNPVPLDTYGLMTGLHYQADRLTRSINDIIYSEAETSGYLVSDVYERFFDEQNMIDILNFSLDMDAMTLNFDIIHPNAAGHEIIASLNYEAYKSYIALSEQTQG